MCCGSAGPQTVVQSNEIPAWLQSFYQQNAGDLSNQYSMAQNIYSANQGYTPYPNERLQGFTNDQLAAMELARQSVDSGQPAMGNAMDMVQDASGTWADRGGGSFQPNAVTAPTNNQAYQGSTLDARQVTPGGVGTQAWSPDAAQTYMNPYTSQVLGNTLTEMDRQNDKARMADNARASAAGAFGGSRQAIVNSERDRNLTNAKSNVTAQAYDQAYQQGMGQFNQDTGRQLQADTTSLGANMQGQLANQQATNNFQLANEDIAQNVFSMNRDTFNQNADRNMNAQLANNNMGLSAFQANTGQFNQDQGRMLAAGQASGGLAPVQQQMSQSGLNTLMNAGNMQQNFGQQNLNMGYQDFQNQQAYPYQQFAFLQSALRGQNYNPYAGGTSNTQTTTPQPGFLQQAGGLGLTALGAYKSGLFG